MSLFIGKDNNNNSILHLTRGATALADIKNGVLSNTVFHSSLTYATWSRHTLTPIVRQSGNTFLRLDAAVAADIGYNRKLFFVVINGSVIQYTTQAPNFDNIYYLRNGGWFGEWVGGGNSLYRESATPSAGYVDYLPPNGANLANSYLYVLNLTDSAYLGVPVYNNSITINNGRIIVKGVDLLNLQYITPKRINEVDTVFSLGNAEIQLINSSTLGNERLEIVSNSAESGIYKNRQAVFSSNTKCNIDYKGTISKVSGSYGSYTLTLPTSSIGSICYATIESGYWYGGVSFHSIFSPFLIVVGSGQSTVVAQLKNNRDKVTATLTASSPVGSNIVNINRSGKTTLLFSSIMCHYFG